MPDEPLPRDPGQFPTTAWTLLRAAQQATAHTRIQLRNELLARYWKPVFVFLRAKGRSAEQAEELTQEFFLRFLEEDCLQQADPRRGRFRTYLLTILVRFLADQAPARMRRQAAFEQQFVSLESLMTEEDRNYEPSGGESAEVLFMKHWAVGLVARVRGQLQDLCKKKGHSTWYDVFDASHPATPDASRLSQEDLARRFHLTREQVRYALEQTGGWFRVLLRAEVRDQVHSDAEIGEEIRELLGLLGRQAPAGA